MVRSEFEALAHTITKNLCSHLAHYDYSCEGLGMPEYICITPAHLLNVACGFEEADR